jgi:hypothetical protein
LDSPYTNPINERYATNGFQRKCRIEEDRHPVLGFVLIAWIGETATFLYLDAGDWEARNREHWQGHDPAWVKLLGQLLEYFVLTLMAMPFVALGVVIGRSARRAFRGHGQQTLLGM